MAMLALTGCSTWIYLIPQPRPQVTEADSLCASNPLLLSGLTGINSDNTLSVINLMSHLHSITVRVSTAETAGFFQ